MSWKHTARRNLRSHLQAAVRFFYEHAGWGYTPGKETPEQGRMRGAHALAGAEAEAASRGWRVEWEDDPEPYLFGDAETEMPKEVLNAVLLDENGQVLESLCGIGDPSRSYGRVVEAELALGALTNLNSHHRRSAR